MTFTANQARNLASDIGAKADFILEFIIMDIKKKASTGYSSTRVYKYGFNSWILGDVQNEVIKKIETLGYLTEKRRDDQCVDYLYIGW